MAEKTNHGKKPIKPELPNPICDPTPICNLSDPVKLAEKSEPGQKKSLTARRNMLSNGKLIFFTKLP